MQMMHGPSAFSPKLSVQWRDQYLLLELQLSPRFNLESYQLASSHRIAYLECGEDLRGRRLVCMQMRACLGNGAKNFVSGFLAQQSTLLVSLILVSPIISLTIAHVHISG